MLRLSMPPSCHESPVLQSCQYSIFLNVVTVHDSPYLDQYPIHEHSLLLLEKIHGAWQLNSPNPTSVGPGRTRVAAVDRA